MPELFKKLFTVDEARNVSKVMKDMVGGLKNVSDSELHGYLEKKISTYLPEKSHDEVSSAVDEIMSTLQKNNDNLRELDEAKKQGISRDAWFAEKTKSVLENACRETAVRFYEECSEVLQHTNETIYNAVMSGKESDKNMVVDVECYEVKDAPETAYEKWDEKSWNDYKLTDLAMGVGKQAANSAIMEAAITTGTAIMEKIASGEEIDAGEIVEKAIVNGTDMGVKSAVSGALYVASEKNMIKCLPKGTPISVFSDIAFTAVENIKIAFKVATGKMTVTEGLSRAGDVSVSVLAGMAEKALSKGFKAIATTVFGPVGAVVSKTVTSVISEIAGPNVKEAISEGIKKVTTGAVNVVKSVGEKIISTGKAVVNSIKSTGRKILNGLKGLFA